MKIIPLETTQGDCADWQYQYFYDGDPVDLTGYTAEFKIVWNDRISPLTGLPIAVAGSINGTITKENADGIINVHLTSAQTASLPVTAAPCALTNATYQLRLTADGCSTTIAYGGVLVNRSVF
jgi:hypothetical protein